MVLSTYFLKDGFPVSASGKEMACLCRRPKNCLKRHLRSWNAKIACVISVCLGEVSLNSKYLNSFQASYSFAF